MESNVLETISIVAACNEVTHQRNRRVGNLGIDIAERTCEKKGNLHLKAPFEKRITFTERKAKAERELKEIDRLVKKSESFIETLRNGENMYSCELCDDNVIVDYVHSSIVLLSDILAELVILRKERCEKQQAVMYLSTRPKAVKAKKAKVLNVEPKILWKKYKGFFKAFDVDVETATPEQIAEAKSAFNNLIRQVNRDKTEAVVIREKDCVINPISKSLMTTVLRVELNGKLTRNILSVEHTVYDLFKAIPPIVAGDSPEEAYERVEKLEKLMLFKLAQGGIEIITKKMTRHNYRVIISTPSQQKVGKLYAGEVKTVKLAEEVFNFGRTEEDFNKEVKTSAVDWLKVNALLATPDNGTSVTLDDVVCVDDVKYERLFKNVTVLDGNGKLRRLTEKEIHQVMADGQAIWLDNKPSCQIRGYGLKAFAANGASLLEYIALKHGVEIPEYIEDIDHNMVKLSAKKLLISKSCWKAAKFFATWSEYVATTKRLAANFRHLDHIWVVRFADETNEDREERRRHLSRQATQQWLSATDVDINRIVAKSVNSLNREKTFTGLLRKLSGEKKPIADRSELQELFRLAPDMLLLKAVQTWHKASWERRKVKAAASNVTVEGQYPYIVMDPIAVLEVIVFGFKPTDDNIGELRNGEVSVIGKYTDGIKLFAIRYPANTLTGQVVINKVMPIFAGMGNVAVLPIDGELILREDGDFDGDEMFFTDNIAVIEVTERNIKRFSPSIIDFHDAGKDLPKKSKVPFGTSEGRNEQIAAALWRSMKFNQVGEYSNLAMQALAKASITYEEGNKKAFDMWMDFSILFHVMAILCLDLVKGDDIPEGIIAKAEKAANITRASWHFKMPINQLYADIMHRRPIKPKYADPTRATADRFSDAVISQVGNWSFDPEGHQLFVDQLYDLLASKKGTKRTRKGIIPEEFAEMFIEFASRNDLPSSDLKIYQKIESKQPIGVAELLHIAAVNEAAMAYTCTGQDVFEKRAEYRTLVRDICVSLGDDAAWTVDGVTISKDERVACVVNDAIYRVLYNESMDPDEAMFIIKTFAGDMLDNVEENLGIKPELRFAVRKAYAAEHEGMELIDPDPNEIVGKDVDLDADLDVDIDADLDID